MDHGSALPGLRNGCKTLATLMQETLRDRIVDRYFWMLGGFFAGLFSGIGLVISILTLLAMSK